MSVWSKLLKGGVFGILWVLCNKIVTLSIAALAISATVFTIGAGQCDDGTMYQPSMGEYMLALINEAIYSALVIPPALTGLPLYLVTFMFNNVLITFKLVTFSIPTSYWVGWHTCHFLGADFAYTIINIVSYFLIPLTLCLIYLNVAVPYYLVWGDVFLLKQIRWIIRFFGGFYDSFV